MKRHVHIALLALSLAGAGAALAQAVHSQAELAARMAAGSTALDALTPHGKRAFLDSLRWGERGLGGFGTAPLTRELTAAQMADVLRLLDLDEYRDTLIRRIGDGAPLRFAAPSADLAGAASAFERFQNDDAARRRDQLTAGTGVGAADLVRYYHTAFDERMAPQALKARPSADLLVLFDIAAQVVLTSGDARALRDLRAIFGEFTRRGIDTRRGLDDVMHDALLGARRFDEARRFGAAHPRAGRASIPRVIDTLGARFKGRSVFLFDASADTLERVAAPISRGTQVVMVVGEGCHFSQAALQAIGADSGLLARLQQARLLVLTPANSAIPTAFMAQVKADYPTLALRAPFSAAEWRDLDATEVPAFFILEDGKVRSRIAGWPGPQQKEVLLRALEKAAP